jgi:hypothetical protein
MPLCSSDGSTSGACGEEGIRSLKASQAYHTLLDDNNRKPLCRLRFNSKQKYISLIDAEKNEEKIAIDTVDDIYKYAEKLRATAQGYL